MGLDVLSPHAPPSVDACGAAPMTRPLEFGPMRVRVLRALLNGLEEDPVEATARHPGADRAQVARGGQDVGRGDRGPGGCEGVGGLRGDLSSEALRADYEAWARDDAAR